MVIRIPLHTKGVDVWVTSQNIFFEWFTLANLPLLSGPVYRIQKFFTH